MEKQLKGGKTFKYLYNNNSTKISVKQIFRKHCWEILIRCRPPERWKLFQLSERWRHFYWLQNHLDSEDFEFPRNQIASDNFLRIRKEQHLEACSLDSVYRLLMEWDPDKLFTYRYITYKEWTWKHSLQQHTKKLNWISMKLNRNVAKSLKKITADSKLHQFHCNLFLAITIGTCISSDHCDVKWQMDRKDKPQLQLRPFPSKIRSSFKEERYYLWNVHYFIKFRRRNMLLPSSKFSYKC